jgi:hypothetical protein
VCVCAHLPTHMCVFAFVNVYLYVCVGGFV